MYERKWRFDVKGWRVLVILRQHTPGDRPVWGAWVLPATAHPNTPFRQRGGLSQCVYYAPGCRLCIGAVGRVVGCDPGNGIDWLPYSLWYQRRVSADD